MSTIPAELEQRISLDALEAFCRSHPVKATWAFGSIIGDWRPDSDIDLLVEFLPDSEPDLLGRLDLQDELEAALGHKVDLVSHDAITNPFIRDSIWKTRIPIYAT